MGMRSHSSEMGFLQGKDGIPSSKFCRKRHSFIYKLDLTAFSDNGGYIGTMYVEGPALICTLGRQGMQPHQGEISCKGKQSEEVSIPQGSSEQELC